MGLEVLLRRNIDGVGNVGEVVRVKNGYARNFLLPKGYAALVSADSLRRTGKDRETEAIRQAEEARYREELSAKLSELTLTIEARAGDDGHLYGSVGPRKAAEAFAKIGYPFDPRQLRFEPVRELGRYEIPVHLTREHSVDVSLWVVQDAREAAEAAAEAAERAAHGEDEPAPADAPAADEATESPEA